MSPELSPIDHAVAAWHSAINAFCLLQPDGSVYVAPHGTKVYRTGTPVAVLNGLIATTPEPHLEELAAMVADYRATDVPWSLQLRRSGSNPAVEQLAAGRGLTKSFALPFMTKTLGEQDLHIPASTAIEIRAVPSDDGPIYREALAAGYEAPAGVFERFCTPGVLSTPGMTAYLVYEDGLPVSTSFGVMRDRHVGVFNISTRPTHRLRGYARLATQAVLRDAYLNGAHTALLHCTPAGRRVYESLGFEVVEEWRVFIGG
ncbi:MAG: N-acetyltransferase [Mitsuaria chitosanitabida]|uniref:GNAT family N-acetyltransferase n=1 Tax=Roseateles chitosanitabidus TaxID=65048 RepID=UPI001B0334DF|nr:GNAT family N-acetyltransferase [Roseateles chitosanitabidus]MBO9687633.1 N-acetyltransferase [Roseateles chitosanitabidus]